MQTLPPAESRKILDAMSIPVVVLRDRSDKTEAVESDLSVSCIDAQEAELRCNESARRGLTKLL